MRLIDGDALKKNGGFVHEVDNEVYWTQEDIDAAHTISPDSLVNRGRWEEHPSGDPMCSECKKLLTTEQDLHGGNKFCPYCGAMMDEGGALMED